MGIYVESIKNEILKHPELITSYNDLLYTNDGHKIYTGPDEINRGGTVGTQARSEDALQKLSTVPAVVVMITAVPSTALTVRKENMREEGVLNKAVLENEASLKSVTDRWDTIEAILANPLHTVIVAAPEDGWTQAFNEHASKEKVWNRLQTQFPQNLIGVRLQEPIPEELNGALNIVGHEIFSINAGQAQASEWEDNKPKVKLHELWIGNITEDEIFYNRAMLFLDTLKDEEGKHQQVVQYFYDQLTNG